MIFLIITKKQNMFPIFSLLIFIIKNNFQKNRKQTDAKNLFSYLPNEITCSNLMYAFSRTNIFLFFLHIKKGIYYLFF